MVNQNNAAPKKNKINQRKIAKRMGVSPSTLSRELKRGKVILLGTNLREVITYSAIKPQNTYVEKASAI